MKKVVIFRQRPNVDKSVDTAVTSLLKSIANVNNYLENVRNLKSTVLSSKLIYCGEATAEVRVTGRKMVLNAFINAYLAESGVLSHFIVEVK